MVFCYYVVAGIACEPTRRRLLMAGYNDSAGRLLQGPGTGEGFDGKAPSVFKHFPHLPAGHYGPADNSLRFNSCGCLHKLPTLYSIRSQVVPSQASQANHGNEDGSDL